MERTVHCIDCGKGAEVILTSPDGTSPTLPAVLSIVGPFERTRDHNTTGDPVVRCCGCGAMLPVTSGP